MVIPTREIVEIMSDLARNENIKVTVSESLKAGVLTGGCAFLGGLLLGPRGIAAGAVMGGLVGASTCNNFRPIADILLHDLTTVQQAMLVNRVNNVIRGIGVEDAMALGALIVTGSALRENILNALKMFITSDLHYSLAS